MLIFSIVVVVAMGVALLVAIDELNHRDRHLKWVDERDQYMVHLFQKVAEARVAPMSNPLDGMKQHGMISRNAVSPVYLQEMDERLNYTQGFLKRALASAKDLEAWESSHPAPPVSRWRKRKAEVGEPIPTPEPETWKTTPSGQRLPDATPAETMEALGGTGGGLAIGEGAFGEEVQ